ncbi:MAG: ATP synthase F0 subunit B [Acidimicrobiales bacterium]
MTFFDDETHDQEFDGSEEVDLDETGLPESLYQPPESEQLLRRIAEVIATARPMPLSASVMINKDEVLGLVEGALEQLPDELRAARWLLKERDEFLTKVRREADDILEEARGRAEHMVQRTEVVKAAEQRARKVVDKAREDARRTKLECDDYVDQKLASFEIVLDRTIKTVNAGRSKLQGKLTSGEVPVVRPDEPPPELGPSFFDQDRS